MQRNENLKVVLGISKTGISCVNYLIKNGYDVVVVDSREKPPCLQEFKESFSSIPFYLGSFDQCILNEASELIVSSGVSLKEPQILTQIGKGINAIGDIELFARSAKAPIIAITGSNGKSTTTSFVGEMAKCAGVNVRVGGNLGVPVLDLLGDRDPELYVIELSSFQLEKTYSIKPYISTILNISQNHLDYHPSMNEYIQTKKRIYNGCDRIVINRGEPIYFDLKPKWISSFGLDKPYEDNYGLIKIDNNEFFARGNEPLLNVKSMKLRGRHNVENALAALCLCDLFGIDINSSLEAIKTFSGLPHRCEFVREKDGVSWYNDSKGTTVTSTLAAINGFGEEIEGKIVLIAGGIGKGADFSPFKGPVKKYVSHAILIGRDADIIANALDVQTKIHRPSTFYEAILLSNYLARPKDIVLMSTACASFDMFDNFMHRGDEFKRLVREL